MDVTFTSPYVKDRRFRTRSFVRSVADWDFSPKGNESRLEAQEREWARNRPISHGFRGGGADGLNGSVFFRSLPRVP